MSNQGGQTKINREAHEAVTIALLAAVAGGGATSPEQQTKDVYRQQTKTVENLRKGFDKEDIIRGEHCREDEYHVRLIDLVKAEIPHLSHGK